MLELMSSLLLASAFNVEAVRDSAIVQIKNGRWEQAYANASLTLTHRSHDPLMLGFLEPALYKGIIKTISKKYIMLTDKLESQIIKSWDECYNEDTMNVNTLHILTVLQLHHDLAKAISYADRSVNLDTLNAFAYFLRGRVNRVQYDLFKALSDYRQSYSLDSTFTAALAMLADIYMLMGRCDSAIIYFKKIPSDSEWYIESRIFRIICNLKLNNIATAESLLDEMKQVLVDARRVFELSAIEDYLNGLKTNTLSDEDTFVVFLPTMCENEKLLCFFQASECRKLLPTTWPIVVLTGEGIDFVYEATEVSEPVLKEFPAPKYPIGLFKEGIQGHVEVSALVDTDGTTKHAYVSLTSGYTEFDDAALDAVKRVKFEPARVMGVPIRVWLPFPINFRIVH